MACPLLESILAGEVVQLLLREARAAPSVPAVQHRPHSRPRAYLLGRQDLAVLFIFTDAGDIRGAPVHQPADGLVCQPAI